MLGDYVDRGPQSAQVLDHLLQPAPPGFERFCLMGNHEQMMLDFLDDPPTNAYWLEQGGLETLQSYGVRIAKRRGQRRGEAGATAEHPGRSPAVSSTSLPSASACRGGYSSTPAYDQAALSPSRPTKTCIWIREPFLSARLAGAPRVVHGHTPSPEPVVTPYRVCLDTQCFLTGRLTAARITQDGELSFLTATSRRGGESSSRA